jgi:hypothetical protein
MRHFEISAGYQNGGAIRWRMIRDLWFYVVITMEIPEGMGRGNTGSGSAQR